MGMIEDGRGKGNSAQVDSNNRLYALSDSRSIIAHESINNNNSYVAYLQHNIVAVNTNELLGHFVVNEDIEIVISHIVFSGWGTQLKFELFFDTSYTSGGRVQTPHNLNRKSNQTLDVSWKDNNTNDLVVTGITAASEFLETRISNQAFLFDFKDALVLGNGNSFSLQVEAAGIADKVRAIIFYYKKG